MKAVLVIQVFNLFYMKVVIPMAGRGTRMRPHTLTVPKPLIPIAGKPIVQRLVEEIAKVTGEAIDEIAFIIGDFGVDVELQLASIAHQLGAKASKSLPPAALNRADIDDENNLLDN